MNKEPQRYLAIPDYSRQSEIESNREYAHESEDPESVDRILRRLRELILETHELEDRYNRMRRLKA